MEKNLESREDVGDNLMCKYRYIHPPLILLIIHLVPMSQMLFYERVPNIVQT